MLKHYSLLIFSAPILFLSMAMEVQADTASLEEIVVYAEKRGLSVQDTATSMEVITTERIEELNIVSLNDALLRVGNAGFATVGSGRTEQFIIRGVLSGGVTPGSSTTPVATLMVDGAVIPNQGVGSTITNAWDVRQIEVLRGAQSTLQGRNSLMGTIAVTTEEPSYESDVRGRATYGEKNTWETSVALGAPIIEDHMAFRIAAQRLESDGFVERTDGSDADEEKSTLVRGRLRIEPESLEDLRWDISATYSDEDDGSVLVAADNPEDRIQIADIPGFTKREVFTFSNLISYDINERLNFVSLTTYARLETQEQEDFDALPDQGFPVSDIRLNKREQDDSLQEFRLLYTEDNFQVLGGILFANRGADDKTRVEFTNPVPGFDLGELSFLGFNDIFLEETAAASNGQVSIGLPATAPRLLTDPLLAGNFLPIGTDFTFEPEFDTFAIFGEASWDISEKVTLTAGLRYEREKASYKASQFNQAIELSDQLALSPQGNPGLAPDVERALLNDLTPLLDSATAAQVAADATPGIVPEYSRALEEVLILSFGGNDNALVPISIDESETYDVYLPKLVGTYHFTEEVSAALSIQRAYRPGGIGINPVSASAFTFDPEYSWNYELALRSIWLDNRLLVNANIFYVDWEDQQVEVDLSNTPQDEETRNVGESELYGFEVQANFAATDTISLFASLGVVETEITEVDDDSLVLEGNEFPFASGYSGSAGINYSNPAGFTATLDFAFRDDSEPRVPNNSGPDPQAGTTGLKNDDVVLTNARVAYDWDNFTAFVYGRNIFDENYLVNADGDAGNVILGDPRLIGVGFSFDF
ncbi:MAG: TonB-dependent receptor [Pseudomonadota bacterium]